MKRTDWIPIFFLVTAYWMGCASEPEPEPARYTAREGAVPNGQVQLWVLEDREGGVRASIAPAKGGELSSLQVRVGEQWVETLYLAEDYSEREGWTGKAPLLWPATGRSLPADLMPGRQGGGGGDAGNYDLNGERYPMPGHGFARDYEWNVERAGASSQGALATLSLRDSETSRQYYPFGFELTAEYRLVEAALEIAYAVEAAEQNVFAMPFSIGNHITFNTPLLPGTDSADMIFRTPSTDRLLKNDHGFPNGEMEPRSHADGIRLAEWEPKVPISLTGYEGDPAMELEDPGGLTIRMSHHASTKPEAPYIEFNVWGDPADGYFSPEPWIGMQNSLNLRQGLIELEPGGKFEWTIRIEFER